MQPTSGSTDDCRMPVAEGMMAPPKSSVNARQMSRRRKERPDLHSPVIWSHVPVRRRRARRDEGGAHGRV